MTNARVPFFRPDIGPDEIDEVVATLRSGWLTTGPKTKSFEERFKAAVGAQHALAVNSCTAALHLAVEALGLKPGQAVLVPSMTFAATAEVVRYQGAFPVLVDCDPETLNMDLADAAHKLERLRAGRIAGVPAGTPAVGMIPVHVGGFMMDVEAVQSLAARYRLWVIDDAAHALPAAWRRHATDAWQQCGEGTADISCFSFYANKTITTGEGGMAVTNVRQLADRMRVMALHGLSTDAWERYSGKGSWDYRIVAPGYKYNLTDIAASLGLHQLARAESMRQARENIARRYLAALSGLEEIDLPRESADRIHAWHLFPIRLQLDRLAADRNRFIRDLAAAGIATSVHWRPLHLHPYYSEALGWRPEDCGAATTVWERLVSLPICSAMREEEVNAVIATVRELCARHRVPVWSHMETPTAALTAP